MQKTVVHPVLGEIFYIKRIGSKSIRVSVSLQKGIRVSLPFWVRYSRAQEFVEQNMGRILKMVGRMNAKKAVQPNPYTSEELASIRKRAKAVLPLRLKYWSDKLNLKYNRVFIKNNRTNWGSCSAKGNINLNMHLVNLPDELCDYVIIHELCHLVHRNHGAEFHRLVNGFCGGREKELSAQLRKWSFLLHRI